MANIQVEQPFQYLTDRNGRALANGKIYIGQPNQDPNNFPQAAFFDVEGLIPAPQPIRTNSAGFPCDLSGNPKRIFTTGDYSIRISDQNDSQITYTPSAAQGFFGVIASDLADNTDPAKGSGLVGFVYQLGATGQTVHQRLARGWVDVKDFGAVGDNLANDKAAFDDAASTGRAVLLPAGTYNVPTGDYSATRFYSFDGATTNNGTIAIVDPLSNSVPVGMETTFSCDTDGLPFGWLPRHGQALNRVVYAQLWAFAEGSGNLVDEVDKGANPLAFGRGDGSSTFSLPDARGSVQGYADAGANVDTAYVLGKRIQEQSATGTGTTINVGVSTPAIRAFGRAVDGGSVDIQELANQVNEIQTAQLTRSTAQETTSGTFKDFSIPAGVKRITISLLKVSTNGSGNNPIIQIGVGGVPETTGYQGQVSAFPNGTDFGGAKLSVGFACNFNITASAVISGNMTLINIDGNDWVCDGSFAHTDAFGRQSIVAGSKTLAGGLDLVRLTTTSGTDVLDGGKINVFYEGQS